MPCNVFLCFKLMVTAESRACIVPLFLKGPAVTVGRVSSGSYMTTSAEIQSEESQPVSPTD